jgi:hypothetical protein
LCKLSQFIPLIVILLFVYSKRSNGEGRGNQGRYLLLFTTVLLEWHSLHETSRMTTRFPFVRIRKRVQKAKKIYESKSVLLPLIDDYSCDKTRNRYKQRQPTSSKKLQSNMALSQVNGKTRILSLQHIRLV